MVRGKLHSKCARASIYDEAGEYQVVLGDVANAIETLALRDFFTAEVASLKFLSQATKFIGTQHTSWQSIGRRALLENIIRTPAHNSI